jgi:hypothetical protein
MTTEELVIKLARPIFVYRMAQPGNPGNPTYRRSQALAEIHQLALEYVANPQPDHGPVDPPNREFLPGV